MDKEESKKKIALGSDHAGFEIKEQLAAYLKEKGYEVKDFGAYSADAIDYPEPAYSTAKSVSEHSTDEGILICGTGIGMSIVANKLPGIRAAVCNSVETAQISKKHNNANVLCLGSRIEHSDSFEKIVDEWLNAKFEEGRHERRVGKIHSLTGI
ncbi:MAG: ribose 5-phosphate isomerase B [Candidatus Marinimicrobia bacterium]|nr:ribose 5-phosphate isomerase B [Candidatus Neomarinimicrobiota bacterium]